MARTFNAINSATYSANFTLRQTFDERFFSLIFVSSVQQGDYFSLEDWRSMLKHWQRAWQRTRARFLLIEKHMASAESLIVTLDPGIHLSCFYGITRRVESRASSERRGKTNSINSSTSTSRACTQVSELSLLEEPPAVFLGCDCRARFGDRVHVVTKWNNKSLS